MNLYQEEQLEFSEFKDPLREEPSDLGLEQSHDVSIDDFDSEPERSRCLFTSDMFGDAK